MGQDGAKMGQDGAKIGPRWANIGPRWAQGVPLGCRKAHIVKNSKNPRVSRDSGGVGRPSFSFAEACEAEAETTLSGCHGLWGSTPLAGLRGSAPAADPGEGRGGHKSLVDSVKERFRNSFLLLL